MKPITVGITTRNRPAALARALLSLDCSADLIAEAIVFDDRSDTPAAEVVERLHLSVPCRTLRDETGPGTPAGRNRLVDAAATEFVLLLDDDAALISRHAVGRALGVLRDDPTIGVVGFAQAEADGRPWAEALQPAAGNAPRLIRAFTGFAHLVRRELFREVGGYQELFRFYGEEKEFCLRLSAHGYGVVYLPDALVMHAPDPSGRDPRRYLRQVTRNDCLASLLTDPFPRPAWIVPARLALYFRMRRGWRIDDPGGFWWIVRDLVRTTPAALRARRPVTRHALRRWRALGREGQPYRVPASDQVSARS